MQWSMNRIIQNCCISCLKTESLAIDLHTSSIQNLQGKSCVQKYKFNQQINIPCMELGTFVIIIGSVLTICSLCCNNIALHHNLLMFSVDTFDGISERKVKSTKRSFNITHRNCNMGGPTVNSGRY